MEIKQETTGPITILHLAGRLDANTAGELESTMVPIINDGTSQLIIDFAELEYISSAGLRVLLLGAKLTKKAGGKVVLCQLRDFIREIFEIAGFMPIFTVTDTCEEAQAQF